MGIHKSKAVKVFYILFLIDAIGIIVYSTTFPTSKFAKSKLGLIVMACLILLLLLLAFLSIGARMKNRKKRVEAYVPLRNISIGKGKEVVLLKEGAKVYAKDYDDFEVKEDAPIPSFAKEPVDNILPSAKIDVALVHIDQVDKEKVTVRVFKSPVALIDVAHYVNK